MIIKKIIPSLFFLGSLYLLINFSNQFWQNFNLIFTLSFDDLFKILYLAGFVLLTGLFFVIFATIAQDYKIILPVIISSAAIPFLIAPPIVNYILVVGFITGFIIIFLLLHSDLKSYLTFSSTKILIPHIRNTVSIITIVLSLAYFYGINQEIKVHGFTIPDQLINTALSFSGVSSQPTSPSAPLPTINQTTLDQLKANPELLKQYGVDPSLLEGLNPSDINQVIKNPISNDSIKSQIKTQFDNILKPYIQYLPYLLAFLFFTSLSFINSILSLLLYPLVWFIFGILDKTGFNKYEVEMREVKKLVV